MLHDDLTILANPGHGNGATVSLLMAAEAMQQIAGCPVNVVFPYLGEIQEDVIKRRINWQQNIQVFFDHSLGALISSLTLRNNDFGQNVADIVAYQESVQGLARRYCREGLTVRGLNGGSEQYGLRDLDFELNHGSRICILDTAFYFFPCLLSDLLKRSAGVAALGRPHAIELIEKMEARFQYIFLPRIHTFTWDTDWQPPDRVAFIPFPRPVETQVLPEVPRPGILVMPSGVGPSPNALLAEAAVALREEALQCQAEELEIYCPPGHRMPQLEGVIELNPRAIPHPNVQCVVGRAGWGTLWECADSETPFLAIPALTGDDPEIVYNLRTIESMGLGVVWHNQPGTYASVLRLKSKIKRCLSEIEKEFGTRDGLEVMAARILKGLH